MRFTIYQDSRQGGRDNNEDRTTYCYSRDALLMVIADGMGGHHHGEIAAQIAVQSLANAFQREARPQLDDPFRFLQKGMSNAHHAILDYAARHRLEDSPRTTCVACVIQDNVAYWAHAGDSRLFLMRNGRVIAQTKDHSRIRLLLEEGLITEAQAERHPDRNKIYSCLGSPATPEIDFSRKTPLEHGDIVLLCTDGLWGVVSGELMAVALKGANLLQAVPMLVAQAEVKGGAHGDNLSVVAVRWEDNYVEAASSAISTQTMPVGEVTTKLDEFGRNPSYKSDLSDDEIEAAIEEIRAAIDKYNPKK
ncbi:serine/threonine protein phosphatase PrpC [Azonexus fungiphilus]|jgi:serine/threonine protein phosphatase PrpC|uniref:Serine/threonine protein phosphatase PrpC n=1 Tax=Azonexus fungiphilus TaxID=146940 RepID=A0A495WTJ7_9RHOO|nr:protein phosphatase 2C domain-containing protein [Azonexus fungiphilus]NHC08325.1 serine/threonine-protein phosphatase [Azonexus fungiphilus]RKT63068.1 serine/threonine protein phosphatase PrpC [Azonexus fungiphilus]